MKITSLQMARFISALGTDAKYDDDAMFEECPFYAFISEDQGVSLRTTVNYKNGLVTFDFDVDTPNGFRLTGSFVKSGHPDFNRNGDTFVVTLFPKVTFAGAFERVDLTNSFKLNIELKGEASVEKIEQMMARFD